MLDSGPTRESRATCTATAVQMVGVRGEPLEQGEQFEAGQRDGQAKRSEEIDGTANQWQPAQVAIEPGGTMTFRIAVARPIRSSPAKRRPRTSGSTPPSASPAHHKVGDSCTVTFPEGRHLSVLLPGATPRA